MNKYFPKGVEILKDIENNEKEIENALFKDLGKSESKYIYFSEIGKFILKSYRTNNLL